MRLGGKKKKERRIVPAVPFRDGEEEKMKRIHDFGMRLGPLDQGDISTRIPIGRPLARARRHF